MKKILITLMVALSLIQCRKADVNKEFEQTVEELKPVMNILLMDQSASAKYIDIPIDEWKETWEVDATNGGIQIAVVKITELSIPQVPFISDLIQLDTFPLKGNIYQNNRFRERNKAKKETTQIALDGLADTITSLIQQPKAKQFTDVNGALKISQQIAGTYTRLGYNIRVIIFSDLEHDLPNESGVYSVEFPNETKVIIIGASPDKDFESIFPGTDIINMPVFKPELINPKN